MSSSRSSSAASEKGEEEPILNISSTEVAEKYKNAARITNEALKLVTEKCVAGASVADLCQFGDNTILRKTGEFSKKAHYKKGIAFPTCISVNNLIAHVAPLRGSDFALKNDDLVKLELGTHVDGFLAMAAHTFVVGASQENKVTGRKADVILSAYYAAEAALRLLKVGNNGQTISSMIDKVTEEYSCKPLENMLMCAVTQNRIEGETSILINGTVEGKKDHTQPDVKEHDVYCVDVLVTTGKGTARTTECDTTIYKLEDVHYSLKSKRSRHFFTYANNQFGLMPFNLRFFEVDENNPLSLPQLKTKDGKVMDLPEFITAKMGLKESREHGLATPFDVQQVEDGEVVAQFKFTVFCHERGPERITNFDFDPQIYSSEHSIKDESIQNLLKEKVDQSKKKKKKKGNKPAVGQTTGVAGATGVGAAGGIGDSGNANSLQQAAAA